MNPTSQSQFWDPGEFGIDCRPLGKVVSWNLHTGRVQHRISLPRRVSVCTALGVEMVAVHGELSEIYILDVVKGEQFCTLLSRVYPDWVTCSTSISGF